MISVTGLTTLGLPEDRPDVYRRGLNVRCFDHLDHLDHLLIEELLEVGQWLAKYSPMPGYIGWRRGGLGGLGGPVRPVSSRHRFSESRPGGGTSLFEKSDFQKTTALLTRRIFPRFENG